MNSCDTGGQKQLREGVTQKQKQGNINNLLERRNRLKERRTEIELQIKELTQRIEATKQRRKIRQYTKIVSVLCSKDSEKYGVDAEILLNVNYRNPMEVYLALFDLSCRLVASINYGVFKETLGQTIAEIEKEKGEGGRI